jgi:hypothetical protein
VELKPQKKAVANATASQYETNSIRDFEFVTSTFPGADIHRLQWCIVIHGRFHAQAVLLTADRSRRQYERKYGHYCCLGFHETPESRLSCY